MRMILGLLALALALAAATSAVALSEPRHPVAARLPGGDDVEPDPDDGGGGVAAQ